MLDRPRHSRGTSAAEQEDDIVGTLRRRHHSESDVKTHEYKVSFAVKTQEDGRGENDDDADGTEGPPRRSADVQELLRRGFGNVKRSVDIVLGSGHDDTVRVERGSS